MKILMLGWELPPNNSGGLGVACLQLCKALSKKNTTVKFVLPYKADHDIDFMEIIPATNKSAGEIHFGAYESANYSVGSSDGSPNVFAVQAQYEAAMETIVDEHEFHVIHAHDWLTFRAGMRARELSGKPLIVHVHSVESDRAGGIQGNPLVHEIEGLGLMSADHIIAVSELTKQKIMQEYHIPASKITVAHNSVDKEAFPKIDSINAYGYLEHLKEQGYKVVVNIGRLTIQKGLMQLLDAAAKVVDKEPKTMFLIVGSGDQEHELIRRSAELGIGRNVMFAGFQRGKQWRDAFSVADLFVMPSVSEPFGLTPLEAIGYGTPSIISKQSGVAEVYKNCLKVDYWDIDKLANDITSMLRYDTLRTNLTDNALLEFLSFNWHDTADKLLNVYRAHAKELEAAE
jgi:glycogen(starch) synthase